MFSETMADRVREENLVFPKGEKLALETIFVHGFKTATWNDCSKLLEDTVLRISVKASIRCHAFSKMLF